MNHIIDNNCLAMESIKLSRKLKNLSSLAKGFDHSTKPVFLLEAISNLEHRIKVLEQKRLR